MPLGAFRLNSIAKVFAAAGPTYTWDPVEEAAVPEINFNISGQSSNPVGIAVKSDETKMYVLDGADVVYQYSMTAGDISTATYDSVSFNMSAEGGIKDDLWISRDGTRMFVVDRGLDNIRSYTLSTAWNISTASYDSKQLDVSGKETTPKGLAVDPDGNYVYVCGAISDSVHQYTMSTPFDLSTATFTRTFTPGGLGINGLYTMMFKDDGLTMLLGATNNTLSLQGVYEYTLSTAWDISTTSFTGRLVSESYIDGISAPEDGNYLYVINQTKTNMSEQYVLTPPLTFDSDANSANLELCVPMDKILRSADVSQKLNSSISSSKTKAGPGQRWEFQTSQYKWTSSPDYGGAMQGDQVGTQVDGVYAVTYDLSSNGGSGFGSAASSSYTLECYLRATSSTSNNNWCFSSADQGGRWLFGVNSSGTITFGNENNIGLGDTNFHHMAIVCDGGTKRFYIDGIYKGAWVSSNTGFNTLHVGEFNGGDANCFRGQMNDLRVYIGVAKYSGTNSGSANFTLPSAIISSYD